jgi:hypothetical protein
MTSKAMKLFDRIMDWLERRPLWQIFLGVLLAFVFLIAMSEVLS